MRSKQLKLRKTLSNSVKSYFNRELFEKLFNEKFKKFHIGNITQERFKDIWKSERYWKVMSYLSSSHFNAQKMCGNLCLVHKVNEFLDGYRKGLVDLEEPSTPKPDHIAFV